jgi:hypothetical protein
LSALQPFDRFFQISPVNDAHDRNGFLIDPIKKPVIGNPQPIERKSKPFVLAFGFWLLAFGF